MSFSSEAKKELGKLNNLNKKEQIKFELLGYLISSNIYVSNKKIKYSTENDYNINRYSKILSNLKIKHNIEIVGKVFIITTKLELEELIKIQNNEIKPKNQEQILKESEENKKAIIRGNFLGSGSINNPENKYHFEISYSNTNNLELIIKLLKQFNINPKQFITEEKKSIYIKEGEEISKILALIGANKAVMNFEEIRAKRDMRGKINRIVNCETANLNKTINASIEQIESIEKLKKEKRFSKLNDNLKEIANLRIENPDMTLIELGQKVNPTIGKSGVNYRLKKIMEIANE